jgi:sporulation protein YlmC with PRC-barrel domain
MSDESDENYLHYENSVRNAHDPFSDWSRLINRPVYSIDGKKIGFVRKLVADYDELVYKLTLKYLRQKGYDIGYNKTPRVKP